MNYSATIKSAHDGSILQFSDHTGGYYRVSLIGPNYHGDCTVYSYEPIHLGVFFRDMAKHWQGWQGKIEWSSLEDELALSATIDSTGHVSLSVQIRSGPYPFDWTISAVLLLEAGALEHIAFCIEKFVGYENAA